MLAEKGGDNPYICDCANTADRVEREQSFDQLRTVEPLVSVGKHVVQEKIGRHRANGAHGLRERKNKIDERQSECGEVDNDARPTYGGKKNEADRHPAADTLLQQ